MARLLAIAATGLLLHACGKQTPAVEDAGQPEGVSCERDPDCPLGQACLGGWCGLPVEDAGAPPCEKNEDCPPGELCVPSTGRCVVPGLEDAGQPDGGQSGSCFQGQTQSCGSSKLGECRLGQMSCRLSEGVWSFAPCVGAVDPAAESCNSKDDDCDGVIDDGLGVLSCGLGACTRTVDACAGGVSQSCVPGPPSAEVCDGQDNDCNGQLDDALAPLSCGTGACARVVAACASGVPQSCLPGNPLGELCNGVDDDCDGAVDDGIGQASCGVGACRRTVDLCLNGQPQGCLPGAPGTESCNGLDDDCDGRTDEELGNLGCGVGSCQRSVPACLNGAPQSCTPGAPSPEVCDGDDDDCNGMVDDGLGATACGVGACQRTQPNCLNGAPQSCTPGSPGVESCNNLDDDCDGQTDEELGNLSCGKGICRRTVVACVNGVPQLCFPGPAGTESCNTLDDDCDGLIDEGCNCLDGNTQPCYTGPAGTELVGLCVGSSQLCTGGNWGSCTGEVTPTNESCNGKDDDCDGQTDQGLGTIGCGVGACARTVPSCLGGVPQSCTPGSPGAESCNGLDDDCDGETDEGLGSTSCGTGACARTVQNCAGGVPQSCTPGTPGSESCNNLDDDCDGQADEGLGSTSCGTGACARTVQNCAGGVPQSCTPGSPSPESCNNLDDDCDGPIDEGLGVTTCGTGACQVTVQNCLGGVTQPCLPGAPGTESCNGKDDDCDGPIDEGLGTVSCGVGACQVTVQACVSGSLQTCTPGTPGTELCNNLDDDCDGATDETFPQQGQGCSTGLNGTCASGQWSCPSGSLLCAQTVFPVSEVCNPPGLDEDCNGIVDDPIACGCNTAIDNDTDGANQCVDCNDNDGSVKPGASERCNGKDDDCDGSMDEGFDGDSDSFTTCGTKPGGGVDPARVDCNDGNSFVYPGKVADCGNAATPNTPNGVDDNCNGYTDETCGCSTQDKDRDGVSECQGDCDDSDASRAPGKNEVCDGKDNDCNKSTMDNCGVSDPCGYKSGPGWQPFPAGTDRCKPDLVCVTNLATGQLTCGSFCNQTSGQGLNDSCAPTEGCFRNLVDSDNLHLCSVLPVGGKLTGESCSLDSDCRSGDCNSQDGSPKYCTDKCTHEAGCSATTTCYGQKSAVYSPNPPNPKIGDYYYSFCRLDARISGSKTLGQSCTAGSSECRTGPEGCFNGKCTQPCCQHADCGAGYVCSINGPKAKTGFSVGGAEIWSLLPSCLSSAGSKVSGQACGASSECKSGICDKALGICVDLCCNDGSCPNGTSCEPVDFKLSSGQKSFIRACVFSPVPSLVEQK